jgi:dTDP-4-amino-4,6-dideoxygalactose transaminase
MTAQPFLPFALPDIGDDEIAEVVDTLKSGWITTGPKAKRFEQAFAEFLGDPQIECRPAPGAGGHRSRPGR